MSTFLVVFLLLLPAGQGRNVAAAGNAPVAQGQNVAPAGNAEEGEALWASSNSRCNSCHGPSGEGAFGPDLAGRQLSVAQFRRAIREPWGIMPAFSEQQYSDQEVAHIQAYMDSLPRVAEPGPWRIPLPAGAPPGMVLSIATFGCSQCHGAVPRLLRSEAGAVDGDFEWFKGMVYDHPTAMVDHFRVMGEEVSGCQRRGSDRMCMGSYSRDRAPEALLRPLWEWLKDDVGFRVPIGAHLSAGMRAANGVAYTLNVKNRGLAGKGLTAEDISISLTLPSGVTVMNATGEGYQGMRQDPQGENVAVWRLSRMAPEDYQTYTITISGTDTEADLRGTVRWTKPPLGPGAGEREGDVSFINIDTPPYFEGWD